MVVWGKGVLPKWCTRWDKVGVLLLLLLLLLL